MKNIYSIIVLSTILLMGSCNDQNRKADNIKDLEAISNLLENYIIANESQDLDLIERIWASDDEIILYGTDSDERLMGWSNIREAIKEQFGYITDTYISASNQFIKTNGNTAWFAETLNYNYMYNGVAHSYEGLRFTGVVEKVQDNWVLVQAHLSVPASVGIGDN